MAILYVLDIADPTNAGALPASVSSSEWFANLSQYLVEHNVNPTSLEYMIHFRDQTELTSFLDTYRLTDATLISDLNAWKAAHSITFNTYFYTLTDASISPTPTPIIS